MARLPDGTTPTVLLAEEAVIAAVLLDAEAYVLVADLEPGDFWNEQNRAMWMAIQHLSAKGELVTVITLAHELATRGALDDVLDEVLIQGIVGNWFTSIGVEAHATIVKQDAERRRLQRVGQEIVKEANRGNLERGWDLAGGREQAITDHYRDEI